MLGAVTAPLSLSSWGTGDRNLACKTFGLTQDSYSYVPISYFTLIWRSRYVNVYFIHQSQWYRGKWDFWPNFISFVSISYGKSKVRACSWLWWGLPCYGVSKAVKLAILVPLTLEPCSYFHQTPADHFPFVSSKLRLHTSNSGMPVRCVVAEHNSQPHSAQKFWQYQFFLTWSP